MSDQEHIQISAALIHLLGLEGAEEFVAAANRSLSLEGEEFVKEYTRLTAIIKAAGEDVKKRVENRQREFARKAALVIGVSTLVVVGIFAAAVAVQMEQINNQSDQDTEK